MDQLKRAVIWDFDGVIADTRELHYRAWQKVFQGEGIEYTEEAFLRNFGRRNIETIKAVLGEINLKKIEEISAAKEQAFLKELEFNRQIDLFPGVENLLHSLVKAGFQLALASSVSVDSLQLLMEKSGVRNYFQCVVSGSDVSEGKPNPRCFLLAAEKLSVCAANCIVIEDAIAGVAAAKNAGMRCLAVTNTCSRKKLFQADRIVDSLEEVSIADMENLLG